jgi:DNA replication protein DnaC
LAAWLDRASIPPRYRGVTFADSAPTPALTAARGYVDVDLPAGRSALILAGPPGAGKSHAMVAIGREIRDQAVAARAAAEAAWVQRENPPPPSLAVSIFQSVEFITAPALLRDLGDFKTQRRRWESLEPVRLLLLDDVGQGLDAGRAETAWALLEELLCALEARRAAVVATTNLQPDALKAGLGDRVVDRLAGGWGKIVALRGPSLRRQAPLP